MDSAKGSMSASTKGAGAWERRSKVSKSTNKRLETRNSEEARRQIAKASRRIGDIDGLFILGR